MDGKLGKKTPKITKKKKQSIQLGDHTHAQRLAILRESNVSWFYDWI
jgi:hypothetical protein